MLLLKFMYMNKEIGKTVLYSQIKTFFIAVIRRTEELKKWRRIHEYSQEGASKAKEKHCRELMNRNETKTVWEFLVQIIQDLVWSPFPASRRVSY